MPHYGVLDCETSKLRHGEIPKTFFWGLATENGGYKRFNSTLALSRFLHGEHKSDPLHLLHHSNFDIIKLLLDGVQSINIIRSHNSKIIMSKWGEHLLLNSHAMFPVGLEKLFKAFGYKKTPLSDDIEYGPNDPALAQRNYEDCVNGLDCMLQMDEIFVELCGESPLARHTVASTAFHAFEKYAGKMPKDLSYLESYRGGRTEVFDTNLILANKYDINSSYPFSFVDSPDKATLLKVRVKSDDWHGPLCDANEFDRLTFPSGEFESWTFDDTLDRYILPNCKLDITILERCSIDLSWLKRVAPMVQHIYDLKQKSDGGLKEACKFLINAGYGRIGLKGETERCRILPYIPDGDDITVCQLGNYGRYIVWDKRKMQPRSNFPMAAFITDNARGRMFSAIKQTSPAYIDTDSSFSEQSVSYAPSPFGEKMGEWKHEGQDWFAANNLKDYTWGGERAVKGGEHNTVFTLKRSMRGQPVIEVDKEFNKDLKKRVLLSNGKTEPIRKVL